MNIQSTLKDYLILIPEHSQDETTLEQFHEWHFRAGKHEAVAPDGEFIMHTICHKTDWDDFDRDTCWNPTIYHTSTTDEVFWVSVVVEDIDEILHSFLVGRHRIFEDHSPEFVEEKWTIINEDSGELMPGSHPWYGILKEGFMNELIS